MQRQILLSLIAILATVLIAIALTGQERPKGKAKDREEGAREAPAVRPLPSDERLLALHRDFVKKAETLAKEYESDKDWGKARTVYEEILKLVPQYGPANSKLSEMLSREDESEP